LGLAQAIEARLATAGLAIGYIGESIALAANNGPAQIIEPIGTILTVIENAIAVLMAARIASGALQK
jgi:hypothetical protein